MLSCGRVVGQLSKITRHAHAKNFSKPLKHVDFISIGCLRYSSKSKKTRTGTTAKVEECVPKSKSFKKVPPLPPPPPPPPPHASAPPVPPPHASVPPQESKPLEHSRAMCEDRSYSCPPTCRPPYQEDCYKPGGPNDKNPGFKYWKHLIAALILAGVSVYVYVEWFMKDDKKKEIVKCERKKKIEPNPSSSSDIPPKIPYLLIGGGTASFSAFRAIKSTDPTAKVLVITNEGDLPYMRPPLSKELWYNRNDTLTPKLIFRQWNGAKRSLFYEPAEFYMKVKDLEKSEKGGIAVATGWNIAKIDVPNRVAYLDDGYKIQYEKCLIATGATPKNLSIFESANESIKEKVIVFRTKEDYLELVCNIQKPEVKNIVIIGGGFLGSELSTSLARHTACANKKVYQVYKEKNIMAQVLPEYLSEWTTKHSEKAGVNCIPNVEVHDCQMKNGKLSLTLTDGQILDADQVIVAIGVEANTSLAKESNLELDSEQGGYLVNAELEARTNLWVAGDAACFYDVKLGRRRIEHHDHAVVSGRLAGENMTGANKPYLHQSMFWSDLGPEVGFEAIGIIDSSLETVGVFTKATEEDTPQVAISGSDTNIRSTGEEHSEAANDKEMQTESQSTSVEEKIVSSTTISDEGSSSVEEIIVSSTTITDEGSSSVEEIIVSSTTISDEESSSVEEIIVSSTTISDEESSSVGEKIVSSTTNSDNESSSIEEKIVSSTTNSDKESSEIKSESTSDNYGKGVVFYLRDNVVVGIVLWNIFNRMSIARQLLARGTVYEEINEAAKLFEIHED